MRLFTGISLPESTVTRVSRLLDVLRPAAQLSWTPPYNLHVTTKFIGEWPESRLGDIDDALRSLRPRPAIDLHVSGIGWLPNPHSPRILFTGVQGGEPLSVLAQDTEEVLAGLGVSRERREYRAHLTLARIRDPATTLAQLRQVIASLESQDFDTFQTSSFALFQSTAGPSGTIYTQLSEFRFTTE